MEKLRNICSTDSCNAKVVIVIFGGFLVHLALGAGYTFGNFAPYFISFLRNRTEDTEIRNVDGLWISAAGSVGNCFGLSAGGLFAHKFGARIATLIGAVVFCGSVAINYFSVQRSFLALIFTYGLIGYLGHKLTYGTPIQTAISWLPKHAALASGLIVSGTGGGSLIFNQIITGYINPENLSPNLIIGKGERYFTQSELLDRVPTCFLILGGTYFGIMLMGIACLSEPPKPPKQDIQISIDKKISEHEGTTKNCHCEGRKQNCIIMTDINSAGKPITENNSSDSSKVLTQPITEKSQTVADKSQPVTEITQPICVSEIQHGEDSVEDDKKEDVSNKTLINGYINEGYVQNEEFFSGMGTQNERNVDMEDVKNAKPESKPELGIIEAVKLALKSRCFYIIWLTVLLITAGMIFVIGLYKAYGQTFIHDDHFLAMVGSIAAIFNCSGRPIWGAVMDRFGYRVAIRCVSVGFSALAATLLLTERLPKGLFMAWICGFYFSFSGVWSMMPSALAKLLGPQNMAINYGIIYTGVSIGSIMATVAGTSLKSFIGFHGLFYMAAGMGAIVFILSFFFNGVDRQGKRI